MKLSNKVIGMAVGQKNLLMAEVTLKGGHASILHFATFEYPEGLSLSTPEKLGAALGQFLRGKKFSTRDVVVGLPAKRLVTRRKEVPPAAPLVAANMLRLQAEGEFSSELDNLVMDYAGNTNPAKGTTVLLMATNRTALEECQVMARAAGLRVQGITSTTAALGRATSRLPGGDGLVLNLSDSVAELVVQHGSDPAHLRHLNAGSGTAPEAIQALAGEIRRAMASIPQNGTPMTLALWNRGDTSSGSLLEQRLSMPVTTPQLRTLAATSETGADAYAPAVAVALTALEPAGMPVDFLHSRLAPPKDTRKNLPVTLGVLGGLLVLGLISGAVVDIGNLQAQDAKLQAVIIANRPRMSEARAEAARMAELKKNVPGTPLFAAVIRDLTRLFPPDPNTIWATSLSNQRSQRDASTWVLTGKARSAQYARDLHAAIVKDKERFNEVKPPSLTAQSNSGLIDFTITFNYRSANGVSRGAK